jgi:hypothetical protein
LAVAAVAVAQSAKPVHSPAIPDCAPLTAQVASCSVLEFSYRVPFGWVDRTQDMQNIAPLEPHPARESSQKSQNDGAQTESPGKTLLAVFERPPGTPGDAVNPTVVIAAEDRASYPQVKAPVDYLGAIAEIAERRGLKMSGDPYAFPVGAKQLARADFVGSSEKTAVRQTSLVLFEKGYILSFTFLSAGDEEIDSLIANLAFTASARKASPK